MCKVALLTGRVFLVSFFLASLMLATAFVSVDLFGIYTITYIPSLNRIIFSFVMVAILAASLPTRIDRIDKLLVWMLVLFSGVPILIPYALGGADSVWMYVVVVFWALLSFQTRFNYGVRLTCPHLKGGWWPLVFFLGIVVTYSLFTAIFLVGLKPTFDFSLVYDIRSEFSSIKIPFANYAYKWSAFIAAPLIFFVGLMKRNLLLMLSGFIIILVLFFATGHKTYLFIIPFVFVVHLVRNQKRPIRWLVIGLSLSVLAGIGSYHIFGDVRLNASFMNRIYVIPAKISYQYHEYFTSNQKVYLSHSVLSRFVEYPYTEMPISVISLFYYDNPDGHPNTGILGDAYMNFGYSGVIILFLLVAITLRLIVWLSLNKSPLLVLSMLIMPIFTWVNAPFLTSFMTAGLFFGLIGVWLLPVSNSSCSVKKLIKSRLK